MKFKMTGPVLRRVCLCVCLLGIYSSRAFGAAQWFPLGPYGGDARSFAADPRDSKHLFLGTVNGWLYESHDDGVSWKRVSQPAKRDDLVLDHILVDPDNPRRLIVGAWKISAEDGGVYISQDAGRTWYEQAQMRGQSVRSMARSASEPHEIAAGTLKGVYLSHDDGVHWKLISPPDSTEIHEIQSLAIDPADPKVIYAGTWHLPWKTEDEGENWVNITQKEGIIDDSDVFSIVIDPQKPATVYLSACSGIYKSLNSGGFFKKIEGIPSSARRTRKLLQDPTNLDVVYAGTTEGLYKTLDAGRTWARMTDPNVVINDVYVDPANPGHVLLATNRGGVLASDDAATTFQASNNGFAARQISSFASGRSGTMYIGVVNDKETGGVFRSRDGGLKWQQASDGLDGRDVFSLATTSQGTLLAGTQHGIFRLETDAWTDSSALVPVTPPAGPDTGATQTGAAVMPAAEPSPVEATAEKPATAETKPTVKPAAHTRTGSAHPAAHTATKGKSTPASRTRRAAAKKGKPGSKPNVKRVTATTHRGTASQQTHRPARVAPRPVKPVEPVAPPPPPRFDALVFSMVSDGDAVYAGSEQGLLSSVDDGRTWLRVPALDMKNVYFLSAYHSVVLAGGFHSLAVSTDQGATWKPVNPPEGVTQIGAIGVDEMKNLWVGAGEGIFYSGDDGATWKTLRNLYVHQVDGIYFDAPQHRVLVASSSTSSTFVFAVHLPDFKVSNWDSGWALRFVRPVGDHLIGATLFDGMVLQPQMVDTPFR